MPRVRLLQRVTPRAWIAIAASTLAIGYLDLWRGGVTIAPLCITLGYFVLVPIAMLAVPRNAARARTTTVDRVRRSAELLQRVRGARQLAST